MFRKIVSYLAYSPAMLWRLGELDKKNKKDLRDTNWSIALLLVLIISMAVLWLGKPRTGDDNNYNYNNPANTPSATAPATLGSHLTTEIELERHAYQIKPGQAINFILSATNSGEYEVSESLNIDLSGVSNYLITLPSEDKKLSFANNVANWNVGKLGPGEAARTTIKAQALNKFSPFLSDTRDRCKVSLEFGSKINLPVDCHKIKLAQIKLSDLGGQDISYLITILILTVTLLVKLVFKIELKLAIKETMLIRQEINSGGLRS